MLDAAQVFAVRDASRRLVRELGFLNATLAGTELPASSVHALVEIGSHGSMTASELCQTLLLEKSSVSRLVAKLIRGGEILMVPCDNDRRSKRLMLTQQGRHTLDRINAFARAQVEDALSGLAEPERAAVTKGLSSYASALTSSRLKEAPTRSQIQIVSGYRPGLIGRTAEMHARFYARTVGFGVLFERKVASEMSEFAGRLDAPNNEVWSALADDKIVGSVAIDGEHLGAGVAHLRWFIVEDGLRGSGIGRRLLAEAVAFCDSSGFVETQLWTFKGLDAARRLYEASGFELAEEQAGRQWGEEVIEQWFVRSNPKPAC